MMLDDMNGSLDKSKVPMTNSFMPSSPWIVYTKSKQIMQISSSATVVVYVKVVDKFYWL